MIKLMLYELILMDAIYQKSPLWLTSQSTKNKIENMLIDINDCYIEKIIDITNLGTPERIIRLQEVLKRRQKSITVVMENIADAHNVSACFRSCDAVGVMEVMLVYHSGQEFPAIHNSTSASARKWVDVRRFDSIVECYAALRSEGKRIYTTHLENDAVSLYEMDLTQPLALVFGNEHTGVSDEAASLADGNFIIPQVGVIRSLNISVACAVSLFEAMRQRHLAGMYEHSELPHTELDVKLGEWLLRK
ncbi:MAG: RNA methyltransferase [Ignavibacteria bacterium]|jgi:tRNA (guanosine-2'-O-)-methyltransferase|nr:RNA methyltransferase [Ignavibacteria bacterium]